MDWQRGLYRPLRLPWAKPRKMVCRSRTASLVFSSCTVPLLRELLPFHHLSCSWDVLAVPDWTCCAPIWEPRWSQTRHLRNSNMIAIANGTFCRLVSLFLFAISTEVLVRCLPPLLKSWDLSLSWFRCHLDCYGNGIWTTSVHVWRFPHRKQSLVERERVSQFCQQHKF